MLVAVTLLCPTGGYLRELEVWRELEVILKNVGVQGEGRIMDGWMDGVKVRLSLDLSSPVPFSNCI